MNETKLIVLDPGHFHASLMQSEMYAGLSKHVSVYAPLGPDVLDYLNRVALFNLRKTNPTSWEMDIHTGSDFFQRMLREHAGNVVIMSGRNRPKISRLTASIDAGFNVLVDKPWIIRSEDMPKLEHALDEAEKKGLVAYDIMTERFEITSILQRALVNDEHVFGKIVKGSDAEPAISARSVHHLMKVVAGVPLRRPAWFFDIDEYGEGLADVGTHVVDLVQWTAFPDQKLDYRSDVKILSGKRWPTVISKADFQKVTGEARDSDLNYYCNNSVDYSLRGVHVKLDILWNWEAPQGSGDLYEAVFRGSKARVELRQKSSPELYVAPNSAADKAAVFEAIRQRVKDYPGVSVEENGTEAHIVIPERLRVGHEAHFAQVTNLFFQYLRDPKSMPAWEKSNMLVKYYISTRGVEVAR